MGRRRVAVRQDELESLVKIINDLMPGVYAVIEGNTITFDLVEGFDYDEMVGVKLLIEADLSRRNTKGASGEEGCP